jgi:hypothetical protein
MEFRVLSTYTVAVVVVLCCSSACQPEAKERSKGKTVCSPSSATSRSESPLATPTTAAAAAVAPPSGWDFDGDGCQDLAVGLPGLYEGGPGAIEVHYSGPRPSPGAVRLRNPIRQQGNDEFGAALASADFDRDGFDDLAVGSRTARTGREDSGAIAVFFGDANGLVQSRSSSLSGDALRPGESLLGGALAAGDFDSDGWVDLASPVHVGPIIGEPAPNPIVVLRGGSRGFTGDRSYRVASPGLLDFGAILAVGDINADGHLDLAESAPDLDGHGGHLTFVPGTTEGLSAAQVLDDQATSSLSVGDFTADGHPDIVAGRPNDGAVVAFGRVATWLGSPEGPRASVSLSAATAGLEHSAGIIDDFGTSVVVADVDEDGQGDVVVGFGSRAVDGVAEAGVVVVFKGAIGALSDKVLTYTQDTAGVAGDVKKFGRFGAQITALDVTGTSRSTVLVSAVNNARTDKYSIVALPRPNDTERPQIQFKDAGQNFRLGRPSSSH